MLVNCVSGDEKANTKIIHFSQCSEIYFTSDASISASSVWSKILNTIQGIKIQNSVSAFNYVGNSHLVRHFVMCTSQHLLQSNITVP